MSREWQMQVTENGIMMGFYTLVWITLLVLLILLVYILYKLNIHGRIKRWIGKPRSIDRELTKFTQNLRHQYANSFAFPVRLSLKSKTARKLIARLFNCKLTVYASPKLGQETGVQTLDIAYCIFSYGIGKLHFASSSMQCDLDNLVKLLDASQFRNYCLDVILKKSTQGLSEFIEKLLATSDYQYTNRCISQLSFLIGNNSLSRVAQNYIKRLQLDIDPSNSNFSESSILRDERDHGTLSGNIAEKTTRSGKLYSAYAVLCESRNFAVLSGQLDVNTLITPDSFLYEYRKMLNKDLFKTGACKSLFLVGEWQGSLPGEPFRRSDGRHSEGLSLSALASFPSFSSVTMLLFVIYLGYFGWSSSSFAAPNTELMINNMRSLENSINNRGMRNLAAFDKSGKQLLNIRRQISKCRRCGEQEALEWKKIVAAYEANYNQYLVENIYTRLTTIAKNVQSEKLAEAIYSLFKTQREYLETSATSSNIFERARLGEIVESDVARQKQINFTYALFLDLIKNEPANLTEYDLGENVVMKIAVNKWFHRWFKNHYRPNSEQRPISKNQNDESTLFDVIDNAIAKKNRMHSNQLPEGYWTVSPRMAKWMLRIFHEMTYSNKVDGKNRNIEAFIDAYYQNWFHCDTGVWKDVPPDLIDVRHCEVLVGRNLHDTAVLAKLIIDQVLSDVSYASAYNRKELMNADVFLKWVLGAGADSHSTIQSMIEERAKKYIKSSSQGWSKELLDLGVVVQQAEYSHRHDNNWYQLYMGAIEKGENSTLAKTYLPLWTMVNNGGVAHYSKTVSIILERQLLSYMLNMRFSINKIVNAKWKHWVQQAEFDTVGLKKFTDNFRAINEKLKSIIDIDRIVDPNLNAFLRFIRPDPVFNFSTHIDKNDRISTLIQNDVFEFYSVPSRAEKGEKVLTSEMSFRCAKQRDSMVNENYKKSYQVKGVILNCEQMTLKANTQTSRCEKTITGKRAVVNKMIDMMLSSPFVDLDCGGGRRVKIDLGFRPEKDIFLDLYKYFKMQVPEKIARANSNEYAFQSYLIDLPKKGE